MSDINLLQDHENQEDKEERRKPKTEGPEVVYTNPGKEAPVVPKSKKQNWVHFLDTIRNKRKAKADTTQKLQTFPPRSKPKPMKSARISSKPAKKDTIIPKKSHSWFHRNTMKPGQPLVQDMKPPVKPPVSKKPVVTITAKIVQPKPLQPVKKAAPALATPTPPTTITPNQVSSFPKFTRNRQKPQAFDPLAQVAQTAQPPQHLFRDEALVSEMDKMSSLDSTQPPKRNFFGPSKEHMPSKPNRRLSNIDVNLMPRDVLNVVSERNESIMLGWVAMSSIIFVLLVFGALTLYGYRLQSNTTDVNGKIETVNQEIASFTSLQSTAQELKNQIDTVDTLLNKHVHWTQVLERFQGKVVPNVVYKNMNGDTQGGFKITAIAESFEDVAEQVNALQASDFVKDVTTTGGNKVTESSLAQDGNVVVTDRGVEFTLSVQIKPETFYLNGDL
ncbi:MAG: hypothetical protein A3F54_00630 [Candidatus Kerfeldbacteria bacterium RIFCSPHIGHO2_12_FULL_48_17]|uniref:Uncharacterized protein n=1 Tax=Candidatus Kerfeldbacteria bacterium RIFCSPHIGHO2_12_FULL_48_17 TaxID=1798542 RepID=A0A1G2B738_9BACT|nr:MAG: hypothetical protein A3F54_00630 [Candidatus Kerfeldbacteria bacterium RIFCSPHIGHO2_12_FULL_48_17]